MKKYRRVMSQDTEESWRVWRRTDSWFQKWHKEFGEFWLSSGKSEFSHFDELLLSIPYKVSAKKSTEKLSLMTLKNDPNFEVTFYLKNWHEEFGEL